MATWTPRPTRRTRSTAGHDALASLAAAVVTIGVTAFAFLVAAAMLLPAPSGAGSPIGVVTSPPAPTASPAVPRGSGAPRAPGAPVGSPIPGPSGAVATPATSPTPAPRLARIRASAPVVVDGRTAGRVTVQALRGVSEPGIAVKPDDRVLVATVRLSATTRLAYDAAHWQLEDDAGARWDPVATFPTNPLGSGILAPSTTRTGSVAFVVPRGRTVRSVVLTDGVGSDLVVFSRPQPSS